MDPAIPDEKPPGGGHEKNDVSTGAVVKFVVGLAIATVVVQLGMWGLFRLLAWHANSIDRPIPAMVEKSLKRLPPAPHLEDRPLAPRAVLNAQEDARLSSYGWVDKSTGIVHVPIDHAIELLAQRGIAETKGSPGGTPAPSATPGTAPAPGATP
jgi:hypothetical protein